MSVSLYFGLPGCGKTTLLTALAVKAAKKKQYDHIYSNVKILVPGVTFIDNSCIGRYDLSNCLILIDEGTLFADNRDYKSFPKHTIQFFLLHRHYNCDIVIFTQQWDGVDKKIRVITDRVYYVYKGIFTGYFITKYYRIPYGIIIPDPKKGNGETLGEIIQGYCKPNLLVRLFCPKLWRPKYYKYFDSWERPELEPLPARYYTYTDMDLLANEQRLREAKRYKAGILLRSWKVIRFGYDKLRRCYHAAHERFASLISPTSDRYVSLKNKK